MPGAMPAGLNPVLIEDAVRRAFDEDLGLAGDITTNAIFAPEATLSARIVARSGGIVAGLAIARHSFRRLDPQTRVELLVDDGAPISPGQSIAEISGPARAVLASERVALNFLIHLSGIASLANQFTQRIAGTGAKICCTRKTLPGLRALQKYAVRVGGGSNHRYRLDDAVLIKDNHIAGAGGVRPAIERARRSVGHLVKIEVEVDSLDQLEEALGLPIDAALLDNMAPPMLRQAVALIDGRCIAEASGGVSLETVRDIAEAGVDYISVGGLTHSAPALDLGLDFGRGE